MTQNRKIIKLRLRQIYLDLANTVNEHKMSNPHHEIGSEVFCSSCNRYDLLSKLRTEQENLLSQCKIHSD